MKNANLDTEAMVTFKDYMESLELSDYAGELFDNLESADYISDAISKTADSNTSIYYSDIMNFMKENLEWVERAISEFGWDGCGEDLHKAGQMGEYMKIEAELYDNLEDVLAAYGVKYIVNALDLSSIPQGLIDEIEGTAMGDYSRMYEFENELDDIIGEYRGEVA